MKSISNSIQEESWLGNSRSRIIIFFLLGFAVRLTYVVAIQHNRVLAPAEVIRVARSLAASHWHLFGNPFPTASGPTAIVAPGYPFVLSLIYSAFGTGTAGVLAQELASGLVSSLSIALIIAFAEAANYTAGTGILAASLGALLPIRLWIETNGSWDTPYDALALVILCILTLRHCKEPRFTVGAGILHGIVWGVAMLFAPAFLPILLAFLAIGWLVFREKHRAAFLRWAGLLVFTAGLILAPWTVRNYWRFGGVFFVRDNLGLELYQANNQRARLTLEENLKLADVPHPFSNPQEARELVRLGELQYNREKLRAVVGWIAHHPGRFIVMTGQRFLYFWFPHSDRLWKRIVAGVITLLAWAGFLLSYRTHWLPAIIVGTLWIVYPMIYYLVQADPRYPYPIYWTLLLMASLALLKSGDLMTKRLRIIADDLIRHDRA